MARNTSALPSSIENVIDENTSFSNINVNSSPKSVTSAGSKTPRRQAPGTPKTPLSASVANSSPLVASSPASSGRRTRKMWTEEEEALLISAVEKVHAQMNFFELFLIEFPVYICSVRHGLLGQNFTREPIQQSNCY